MVWIALRGIDRPIFAISSLPDVSKTKNQL